MTTEKGANVFVIAVAIFGAVAVPIITPLCLLLIVFHLSELLEPEGE